ncbi:Heparanase-like protein 2 [Diplonema papillatum]|nr:Heparanase-like protein 2 [Diplonema papillatum]|eukprot:gene12475-19302_t
MSLLLIGVLAVSAETVTVDSGTTLREVNDNFVCVNMDWWPENHCDWGLCIWKNASILTANLTDARLIEATRKLGKPHIRIGGTQGDTIVYKVGDPVPDCPGFSPPPPVVDNTTFTGGCLTMERWEEIYEFTRATGAKLVFGISANYGRAASPTGDWDPSNARALMKYTVEKGWDHIYAFEYGNELPYNASVFSKGIHQMHATITEAYANSGIEAPKLVTPDEIVWNEGFFSELMPLVSDVVYAVSWHDYPLGSGYPNPGLENSIMDPAQHDQWIGLGAQGYALSQNLTGGRVKVWMGESGGATLSGHESISNTFMHAFWYLDSMGGLAAAGQDAFCRQAFVGGFYSLLDWRTYLPNPDYFGALLFKTLMGPKVLKATSSNGQSLRAYAHCTPGSSSNITVLVLNYANASVSVTLPPASSATRLEYHMTSLALNSTDVYLNGGMLTLQSELSPSSTPSSTPLVLTNRSYAFVVYTGEGICGGSGFNV